MRTPALKRLARGSVLGWLILGLLSAPLYGKSSSQTSQEIKRTVLGLWSSKVSPSFEYSLLFRHVEFVLNHLGLQVEYVDIDDKMPVPAREWKQTYVGLVTLFEDEQIPAAEKLYKWLDQFVETGVPWVSIGYLGFADSTTPENLVKLMKKFGIRYDGARPEPVVIRPAGIHPDKEAYFGYERSLGGFLKQFPPMIEEKGVTTWLHLRSPGSEYRSSAIFTSPRLSVAYGDYGLYLSGGPGKLQWQLNPFAFFREALNVDGGVPVPEVALLNGRRVFFAHVDGDGFNSIAQWDRDRYCGEVIEGEVFQKYPDLPFGASLIVAEVEPTLGGNPRIKESAQRVLSLPNVEPASHTYFHPLVWRKGITSLFGETRKMDLKRETVGSVAYLEAEITKRPLRSLYWSGDCDPPEEALRRLRTANILNLNGGDGRYDSEFPSLAFLSPLGRPVGKEFQVYTVNANETIYTHGWTERHFAFRMVLETFENSAKHKILKPANPYFHYYSGELRVGLKAVQKVLDWAYQNNVAPVFPSTYIRSVNGFRSAEIRRTGKDAYTLRNAQGLRTLRIDSPAGKVPDMKLSKGLLGYSQRDGSLYLNLAPEASGSGTATIRMKPQGTPSQPYLETVGGLVHQWLTSETKIIVELGEFARPPLVIAGVKGEQVSAKLTELVSRKTASEEDGARYLLPVRDGKIEITFTPSATRKMVEIKL